uniref:Alkyl hydroperoxide reductase/ Thiol specific antioxidant/ Mal allergen n=1 Tax=Streptomyces sp. F12 TaxID=1436084 RepID=V9Z891_9ACTN|nr:peroxiredoxin family protein [Streptomyces sp. F12]AHE40224.1 Alkyl hydroperoxide reductase/ Thiol specific antioxidant/ Mal allergen [Streptomyces sp. F12]
MSTTSKKRPPLRQPDAVIAAQRETKRRRLTWIISSAVAVIALVVLYAVFSTSPAKNTSSSGTSYDVGSPGIGKTAPAFTLAASTGKQVSLSDFRGKNVLLYFQEGLTCQPCWDQMTALEKSAAKVRAAGVDQVVSITTDPADLITRKTHDMSLTTPVLSDPGLKVSKEYGANQYGMMGTSRDGHSFLLVGPDGTIRWRADYGGAPDYTMYVAVDKLLADLKAGVKS